MVHSHEQQTSMLMYSFNITIYSNGANSGFTNGDPFSIDNQCVP